MPNTTARVNMHSVPTAVKAGAKGELSKLGYKLIFICHHSNHPDDKHTFDCIGYNASTNDYAKLGYNSESGGLYWGHYHLTFAQAMLLLANDLYVV